MPNHKVSENVHLEKAPFTNKPYRNNNNNNNNNDMVLC
jgi:hypothetical protein